MGTSCRCIQVSPGEVASTYRQPAITALSLTGAFVPGTPPYLRCMHAQL
jgi:hypothetical protein